jgi:hypothetical protein
MSELVISGLVRKRAEVAGEIEFTQQRLKTLVSDLEHLDATILQFDPDYRVEVIRPKGFRPPSDWANKGEMSRIVLNVLRQSTEPMTTRDLAYELMVTRGLDTEDEKLLRKMTKRVGVALRTQRENGLTKSSQGTGQFMVWEIG